MDRTKWERSVLHSQWIIRVPSGYNSRKRNRGYVISIFGFLSVDFELSDSDAQLIRVTVVVFVICLPFVTLIKTVGLSVSPIKQCRTMADIAFKAISNAANSDIEPEIHSNDHLPVGMIRKWNEDYEHVLHAPKHRHRWIYHEAVDNSYTHRALYNRCSLDTNIYRSYNAGNLLTVGNAQQQ